MKFNVKLIARIIGLLLIINGTFMLFSLSFSLYFDESSYPLGVSSIITFSIGLLLWVLSKNSDNNELKKKDGYLIVTMGWIFMSVFGSLPYLFSGSISAFDSAMFETVSGYTTTGASVIMNIENIDKGILFWRSLTQWVGGMGIIVLAIAILPLLGIGGMQLFVAEAPGISPDKMKPRIKDVAKRLWYIYLGLTLAETLLLMIGGMGFYDAFNHALTTMATGGFSTKNESIKYFDSNFIQYVIIVFMLLAGTNFTLIYYLFKGKIIKVWMNEEFRYYTMLVLVLTLIITFFVYEAQPSDVEKAFRDGLFQVVSMVTTTGFITADYTSWTPFLTVLFFLTMFLGASAGSTSGGIKLIRHLLLIKNSFLEMKRQLHPSAVIPVRINGKAVSRDITYNVMAFVIIYLLIFAAGVFSMSLVGLDFESALGATATCLANIGPGLGRVGPVDNFSQITPIGKYILMFLMLLGRLELFTVLMLFNLHFWRKG